MSEQSSVPTNEKTSNPIRPDPLFKDVTRRAALAAGLELLDIELPQLLRADLVLSVPQGKDLSDTLFDFLLAYSILEFKLENDTLDGSELDKNLARSLLFLSENPQASYSQLLTVFICAERPDSLLEHLKKENLSVTSDQAQPWLLHSQFGPLQIAIVVCRLLPLERKFYDWLLFAPASSVKWREFVKMLIRNGEKALIEQVKMLRLKEYRLMTMEFTEMLKDLTPEERAEREKDWLDLIEAELIVSEEMNQGALSEVLSRLKPQTLLSGLTPEKIASLTPEQRQKLLALLNQPDTLPDTEKPKSE